MNDPKREQLEIFSNYLKKNALKMTRQRELILETFLEADGHLSADELFSLVRQKDSGVGFATVFRTLKALTECNLARETDFRDGRARFEKIHRRPEHHHIVCEQCNRTIEFYSPELKEIEQEIAAKYHLQAVRNRFQIFGICEDCQKKKAPSHEAYDSDLVFARDALKIAMETEKRGISFYAAAADNSIHASARQAFLRMLEEEKRHYRDLEKEWHALIENHGEVLDAPVFLHFDFEALKRIFPSREVVSRKLKQDLDEQEALKLAMNMEQEAFNFFSEYADRFTETRGRDIFLRFAAEEQEHYELMKTELERLQANRRIT